MESDAMGRESTWVKSTAVVSDRLVLYHEAAGRPHTSFAQDARAGLLGRPKSIPARYLYDALGSALFEAITLLPEYSLTRVEAEILERNSAEIIESCNGPIEMVELGSGSGRKTRILIEAALRRQPRLHYKPIDISPDALIASTSTLLGAHADLSVTAFAGDYQSVLSSGYLSTPSRVLALFLGSSIGNYAAVDAIRLLRAVCGGCKAGDAVLLGADLCTSRDELELAYNDPTGVTECFNRNILGRINRELGGHFAFDAFRYVARYDEKRRCVDAFQESTRAQRVRIEALDIDIDFAAGERIHTESSHKYDRIEVQEIAAQSGFVLERVWLDDAERYSINLLKVK